MNLRQLFMVNVSVVALTIVIVLSIAQSCQMVRPVQRLPELHFDVTAATARELERCQALTKRQVDVLDEDRELEGDIGA